MLAVREGFDGSEVHERSRPIAGTSRKQVTSIRCRPGSFEWRYGRAEPGTTLDMLYLAGTDFGRLWERAGMDGPGTIDWAKEGNSPWRDLSGARLDALAKVKSMSQELGKMVTARLVQYIPQGKTSSDIAMIYGIGAREIVAVLDSDLSAVAAYFGYIQHPSRKIG